jgi:hypothetical protein
MPATYEYTPPQLNITEWAAAFYSLEEGEIVVITDNFDRDDPEAAYLLLVHEMVHAYQDHGRDLEALSETYATSFDRFLGLRAAIEGEAMYHQSLTELELAGLAPGRVDWDAYYDGFREYVLTAATESEVPSQDAVGLFPYPYGSQFIYESDDADGFDGIDAVFETPPDSVRQVMGGYDAWPTLLQNRDDLLNPHALPVLPDRYTYLGGGHQSVWLLNTMLQRTAGYAGRWASAQLYGVSADYLSIHRDEESGELVAVWRIQSDEPNYLLSAIDPISSSWRPADTSEAHPHVFTTVDGDIVLVATTGDNALPVLAEIAGWQSLDALQVDPPVTRSRHRHELRTSPLDKVERLFEHGRIAPRTDIAEHRMREHLREFSQPRRIFGSDTHR